MSESVAQSQKPAQPVQQQPQLSDNKKLRNQSVIPFLAETDPRNPYGPNYETLPYSTKVVYKFNRLKKHIHMTPEDHNLYIYFHYETLASIIFGVGGGALLALGLKRFVFRPLFPRAYERIDEHNKIFSGFFAALCSTGLYVYSSERYTKYVCEPYIERYVDQAIKNLSLIHISEPTRRTPISYAVFCLKKKKADTS
eukprot:TRINITY_DN2454_c0_g2_i10.p1 TRINITY_DN2454_c0_g2~~TRINITY_DN2454_c0_g2_i10.p1  ORF type:complete len:197 (-),score=25.90 TRINITY_DN2454_c0_g2_i10:65-655(-)